MASYFFTEPFYSLSDFDRLFDKAFDTRTATQPQNQLQRTGEPSSRFLRPRMDVHEDKEKNLVTATFELPGLSKENVSIDVHDGLLTVAGESRADAAREEGGYVLRERRAGRFKRTVPVPKGVQHEEIKAAMQDGVLTVTFPRSVPEEAPKKITIS